MRHLSETVVKRVYEKIVRFGKDVGNCHHFLEGLYAHKSSDGFVISVSDAYNLVNVSFENRVQCVLAENNHQEMFYRKVKALDKKY